MLRGWRPRCQNSDLAFLPNVPDVLARVVEHRWRRCSTTPRASVRALTNVAACAALLLPLPHSALCAQQYSSRLSPVVATAVIDRDFLTTWSPEHVHDSDAKSIAGKNVRVSVAADDSDSHRDLLQRPDINRELRMLVRLLVATVVGGIIGVERRTARSLAGIRTFSLVSLGAAIFMSTAIVGCPGSDPVRASAAISTSVGFLGAGALHQGRTYRKGMTTAAGIWLAASLGICCAVGMYITATTGALGTVLISRYFRFDSSLQRIPTDREGYPDYVDADAKNDFDQKSIRSVPASYQNNNKQAQITDKTVLNDASAPGSAGLIDSQELSVWGKQVGDLKGWSDPTKESFDEFGQ